MKIWQILTVSAAAAVTLPAFAQMASAPMAPPVPPASTRADVEANVRERLGRFDTDKDGTVTSDEMKSYTAARMKARNDERFAAMDSDKNGSISRAEFDAHHTGGIMAMGHGGGHLGMAHGEKGERVVLMERRMMRGPDGAPMPPEPPMPPLAPGADGKPMKHDRMRMMMGGHDSMMWADGDGKGIVIGDAVKKALERFDAADTNKDGKISPEERKAQRGAWRAKLS
jgi:hypothetical protein